MIKCMGCERKAAYLVHEKRQPHCESCMKDALCSEPTMVIDIESLEAKQLERKQSIVA